MKREIILSVVTLAIVSFAVLAWGSGFIGRKAVEPLTPLVKVLVAKQAISQWSVIRDPAQMFEEREMAASDAAQGYMSNFNDLRDQYVKEAIEKGKPITSSMLLDANKPGLEALLGPSIHLRCQWLLIAKGNIKGRLHEPGELLNTFVDIFYTEGNDRKSYSSIIVKNVQIRAIDARPISADEFAKEDLKTTHTVIIEVTKEQAYTLSQLRERGGVFGIVLHGGRAAENDDQQR